MLLSLATTVWFELKCSKEHKVKIFSHLFFGIKFILWISSATYDLLSVFLVLCLVQVISWPHQTHHNIRIYVSTLTHTFMCVVYYTTFHLSFKINSTLLKYTARVLYKYNYKCMLCMCCVWHYCWKSSRAQRKKKWKQYNKLKKRRRNGVKRVRKSRGKWTMGYAFSMTFEAQCIIHDEFWNSKACELYYIFMLMHLIQW